MRASWITGVGPDPATGVLIGNARERGEHVPWRQRRRGVA